MLQTILQNRGVPALKSREDMLATLLSEEYGTMPPAPDSISFRVEENVFANFCAGKATISRVHITVTLPGGEFTFPISAVLPTDGKKHPFFVFVNFRDAVPDRHMPTEELVDNGFAVLSFCYNDVTRDNGDMTDGLAGILYPDGVRGPKDPGKIAMWAWALSRVMDYAETLPGVLDLKNAIVCGHSRLGKTALMAGATDKRFAFTYSNDSGCSGAAITREKVGETVEFITDRFPYWFCDNYKNYINRESAMPFDQHYLIGAIAPRFVCVGSAAEDSWADPDSEMLACTAASPAFEAMGVPGFVSEDRLPQVGDRFFQGTIGYHMRAGLHFFSREDWLRLIDFVNLHRIG